MAETEPLGTVEFSLVRPRPATKHTASLAPALLPRTNYSTTTQITSDYIVKANFIWYMT